MTMAAGALRKQPTQISGRLQPIRDEVMQHLKVICCQGVQFTELSRDCCGNAGRDYVLRRVLRRGVRYGQDTLKAPPGFFHGLVDSLVASMGHFYPELVKARDQIVSIIRFVVK